MNELSTLTDTVSNSSAKNLSTIAFDQIRNDILLCRLRPLERLRINDLTERYAVGATAVREALSRLVTDGLVVSEDQRGFCVSPVSRAELLDLTQTRVDIETLALGKAIALGDLDWESQVISSCHRLSKTLPPDYDGSDGGGLRAQWGAAHRQFHESLVAGCNSPWLIRITQLLLDKSERYRNLSDFTTKSKMRDIVLEHQGLMAAVLERDFEKTKRMISEHFWLTTNLILESGLALPVPTKGTGKRVKS
jgi:DNA-binding GntR family transcriptional regulator